VKGEFILNSAHPGTNNAEESTQAVLKKSCGLGTKENLSDVSVTTVPERAFSVVKYILGIKMEKYFGDFVSCRKSSNYLAKLMLF